MNRVRLVALTLGLLVVLHEPAYVGRSVDRAWASGSAAPSAEGGKGRHAGCVDSSAILREVPSEVTAVSLRALESELRSAPAGRSARPDARTLGGLTDVLGYVVDDRDGDIILFGTVETGGEPVHTEDFVVALRNVWLRYAERRGNTILVERPGCTIDPKPEVMARLQAILDGMRGMEDTLQIARAHREWLTVARSMQTVQVFGVPHDSRFAATMVHADYRMKDFAGGAAMEGFPGWVGLAGRRMEPARRALAAGEPVTARTSMDRFWFCAGETRYGADEGIVLLRRADVVLLTEAEYLSAAGSRSGTGKVDPDAAAFACDFTRRFSEIARREAIFRRLAHLYRLVSLAIVLHESRGEAILPFFLNEYPVPRTEVERELAGRADLRTLEHHRRTATSEEHRTVWFLSCGGVEIDPRPEGGGGGGGRVPLPRIRETILKLRPSPGAAVWRALLR